MDESGLPHLLEMVVVDKTEDDICIMDMKQAVNERLECEKPNYMLDCEVGKILSDTTLLAVSSEGYSVFVTYDSMDTYLTQGDHIKVMLKDGKWFQKGFLQAEYYGKSDVTGQVFGYKVYNHFAGKISENNIPVIQIERPGEDDGSIILSLNDRNVPELRLSHEFSTLLDEQINNKENQSKETTDAFLFLKQKVDAAQGFINAIKQRQQTLVATMQAIIDLQRPFFLEGDETLLKPMILKDVAEKAKLDVSTISRVSNSKYVQTNFGIFPLRFFFSDGYTTEEGEELSVREIKQLLKECTEHENKENPYNDDELADILREKGYPIARRTVAKYRQQLNIPTARLRRI